MTMASALINIAPTTVALCMDVVKIIPLGTLINGLAIRITNGEIPQLLMVELLQDM